MIDVKRIHEQISNLDNAKDFAVSEMKNGICIKYQPSHLKETCADFTVYIKEGSIKMCQNTSLIPIVVEFPTTSKLFEVLKNMDKGNSNKR